MRSTAPSFFWTRGPRQAGHNFPRSREDPTSHHVSPSHDRRRHHADRGARSPLAAARSDLRGRSCDLSCPFAPFLFARWGFFRRGGSRQHARRAPPLPRAPDRELTPGVSPYLSSRRTPRVWSGRDSSSSRLRGPSRSPSKCSPRPSRCVRRVQSRSAVPPSARTTTSSRRARPPARPPRGRVDREPNAISRDGRDLRDVICVLGPDDRASRAQPSRRDTIPSVRVDSFARAS